MANKCIHVKPKGGFARLFIVSLCLVLLTAFATPLSVSAAQSLDATIDSLHITVGQRLTEESADAYITYVDEELLPLAENDLQRFELYSIEATCFNNSGRRDEGVVKLEKAMEYLPKENPKEHPQLIHVAHERIAQEYYDLGKLPEALRWVKIVLEIHGGVDDGGLPHWQGIHDELVAAGVQLPTPSATTATASTTLSSFFEKYYTNDLMVVEFERRGSVGQSVDVAAKLVAGLDAADLKFYAYNATTNTYSLLSGTAHWVDANGYVHFKTSQAGAIIISDGLLTK